jgi:RimJ/RimL family protein N-acetyltransferase
MTAALGLVAEHAFAPEGFALETLHWDAVAGNTASAIVAKRTGFTFLGTRPSHTAIRDELHSAWVAQLHATDARTAHEGWPV